MDNQMTQRDSFWNKIYELEKINRDIVVVTADMGAPALDKFRRDFASRFVNAGIAEQNALLISSGMAMTGKRVFVYAIAPFITIRCLEQTRVNSGIMNIPITIVGVSGGFGYVDAGPTHHSTEDLSMMRSIPHITVHSISDNTMAAYFAEKSCTMKNTNYVRLDRQPLPILYKEKTDFSKGLCVLKEGSSYIIATGNMVHMALKVADELNKKGLNIGVIDLFELPIQQENLLAVVKSAERLMTLEEHYFAGGLGSAVCEVLMDHQVFKPLKRIALAPEKGYCYEYGERESLQKYFGVDYASVLIKCEDFLSKKLQLASI